MKVVKSTLIKRKKAYQNDREINLFDIDGLELQKMFRAYDEAMEHRKNDPAITHPQLRLVKV